jgi:hypothetical protein
MFKRGRKEQQLSMDDQTMKMSDSLLNALRKSWAEDFYNDIFLSINEDRFSPLYSKQYSRPNSPVNILVSLLILKEHHSLTDDELLGSLFFDYRFQHALGITDINQESICINTLTNFRQRLVKHEIQTNEDLLKQEIDALANKLAEVVQLNKSMARMDSFMLSSSCKKLTRLELVFNVVQNMVHELNKRDPLLVPSRFQDYLKDAHKNNTLYHTKTEEAGSKLEVQIENAAELYRYVVTQPDCKEGEAYKHLSRLLSEQCIETEDGVVIPIEAKNLSPNSLQNPSDPDATYRNKGGKGNVGFSVNLVEVRDQDKKVSIIMSHDVQNNLHSDADFGEEFVSHDSLAEEIDVLTVDGTYYRQSTVQKAKAKNIELNFSNMTGRKAEKEMLCVNLFKRDGDGCITECPAGHQPTITGFDQEKQIYVAKFNKSICADCPIKEQCPIQEQKKFNTVRFTVNKL